MSETVRPLETEDDQEHKIPVERSYRQYVEVAHVRAHNEQGHRDRIAQSLWSSHHAIMWPECQT